MPLDQDTRNLLSDAAARLDLAASNAEAVADDVRTAGLEGLATNIEVTASQAHAQATEIREAAVISYTVTVTDIYSAEVTTTTTYVVDALSPAEAEEAISEIDPTSTEISDPVLGDKLSSDTSTTESP